MAGPSSRAPVLPAGTQVVLRQPVTGGDGSTVQRGATGRVLAVEADGRYLIRLADGREVRCGRSQVSLRRAQQRAVSLGRRGDSSDGHVLVREHSIYAAVVGSKAFGLDTAASDVDTRGVYVAPTDAFWSLVKPPTHVEGPADQWFSWEVERFCELALRANPNALEVLHSPLVVIMTPAGRELVGLRAAFVSQLVYQTYSGYVLSQFKKLETDIRLRGAPRWKHVMHLLRLLISARDLLADGILRIDVAAHRDQLLAVSRGELSWDAVESWRLRLHHELDAAMDRTLLPAEPDVEKVDAWLRSIRARSAGGLLP